MTENREADQKHSLKRADFLLEIGTEELPPAALESLSGALADNLQTQLSEARLDCRALRPFATPRRLAVIVDALALEQTPKALEKRGPAVSVAFDHAGEPTRAALGFARSCGVSVDELDRMSADKGEWLVYRSTDPGQATLAILPGLVSKAIAALPIPKRMRWGAGEAVFVRPVHWLVAVLGDNTVPMALFGIDADRYTRGHRFHHPETIRLERASEYETTLEAHGWVIADFKRRRAVIREQVEAEAKTLAGQVRLDEAVLDEVTALVEWPVSFAGAFERRFLTLPDEVLIVTLEVHQRYFPVYGDDDRLLPAFIGMANIRSKSPEIVRKGNERVVRPRLADALFFWEQDRQHPLTERVAGLERVLFQNGLGTMADRVARVGKLTSSLARATGADTGVAAHAASLSKADLLTDMVGEFPELQGIMGRYYALAAGEKPEVAEALEEQYLPRFAGDSLPTTPAGRALAIADRVDTLCGIFALGKRPSGEKDPFALRRAALSVLRILVEGRIDLDLRELINHGLRIQPTDYNDGLPAELTQFFLERLRAYYAGKGVAPEVFNAVAAVRATHPLDFQYRVAAVEHFLRLPEARELTAAHKRIRNILRQAGDTETTTVSEDFLKEGPEDELHKRLLDLERDHASVYERADYTRALLQLADIREAVDAFFASVKVMADDRYVRDNRLALLRRLDLLCRSVADISCLPG